MRHCDQLEIYGITKFKEQKNEKNTSDNSIGICCYGLYDWL